MGDNLYLSVSARLDEELGHLRPLLLARVVQRRVAVSTQFQIKHVFVYLFACVWVCARVNEYTFSF